MSVRDLCIGLLLEEGGQIVREDVIFHDILEKGTLLGTHTGEDGFSLKMYGYYWVPSIGGKHSLLKSQDITALDNSSALRSIYTDDGITYTNQLIKYGSSGLRFGIYSVVCKNDVPLYAVVCNEYQGFCEEWQREYDPDGKPFFYRQKGDFQVTGTSGTAVIGLPKTFTDSQNANAVFVTGEYHCLGGGFTVNYTYMPYGLVYNPLQQKYIVREGTRQSASYSVACSITARLIPYVLSDHWVIYSDLDTEELITVFQELINAMRKEAEIDSIDIEIREPEE